MIRNKLNLTILTFILAFLIYIPLEAQKEVYETCSVDQLYDVMPDIPNCEPGVLKQAEKDKILNMVNEIRELHGLKPVIYDNVGDEAAAKAALICAANGALSHQPPGNWHCYSSIAADGAENSNLYINGSFGSDQAPESEASIIAWMHDNSTENVGHRRAIINPFLKSISFGRVDGNPIQKTWYASSMTLKYLDNLNQVVSDMDIEYVAFPYHQYPPEYVDKNWYMSFSVVYDKVNWWNNSNVDFSNVSIEMTDQQGMPAGVKNIIYDKQGWGGLTNCLKWKVANLQDNVKYTVTISNLIVDGQSKEYTYWFRLGDVPTDPPGATTLATPENGTEGVDLETNLTWNPTQGAETYNLQVALDEGFSNILVNETGLTGTQYVLKSLDPSTEYFWHVAGVNKGGAGPWSDAWSFETRRPPITESMLLAPAEGEEVQTVTPGYIWLKLPNAESYHLQVCNNDQFTSGGMFLDKDDITDTAFATPPSKPLYAKQEYFVRVRGINPSEDGPWSDTRSFKTYDPSSVSMMEMRPDFYIRIFPNPFSRHTLLELMLPAEGYVRISFYDMSGAKSLPAIESYYSRGQTEIPLDASGLAPGKYVIAVITKYGTISSTFEIVK